MCAKNSQLSFEKKIERLQEIVTSLEQGQVSLEESMKLYKEGLDYTKKCREELEKARHEIKILNNGKWNNFQADDDCLDTVSLGDE